jgi:hypothetical protein
VVARVSASTSASSANARSCSLACSLVRSVFLSQSLCACACAYVYVPSIFIIHHHFYLSSPLCTFTQECGGSSICEHKRQKSSCKECKGSLLCPHGTHTHREKRRRARDTVTITVCVRERRRYRDRQRETLREREEEEGLVRGRVIGIHAPHVMLESFSHLLAKNKYESTCKAAKNRFIFHSFFINRTMN